MDEKFSQSILNPDGINFFSPPSLFWNWPGLLSIEADSNTCSGMAMKPLPVTFLFFEPFHDTEDTPAKQRIHTIHKFRVQAIWL